jgi:hypothetical protein
VPATECSANLYKNTDCIIRGVTLSVDAEITGGTRRHETSLAIKCAGQARAQRESLIVPIDL